MLQPQEPDTGSFVLVAINARQEALTLELSPKGFRIASLVPYITDATRNLQRTETTGPRAMPLAARSVTTFVGMAVQ